MSRITGNEVKNLMEAYGAVYAPQELTEEQVWEEVENWVNSLLEEGYDLSDYTWEEMYEAYLSEKMSADPYGVSPGTPRVSGGRGPNLKKFFGFDSPAKPGQGRTNVDPYGVSPRSPSRPSPAATRPTAAAPTPSKPTPTAPARPSGAAPAAPARPSGGVRPAAPARPVATQTGDKAKDTATWAKANPSLAAAAAEKARIRGTQQTDNPLMKDMRSRLPMNSPSVQSPDVAKLGRGNQSLVSNPNAFKAATPSQAVAAAPSTSAAASGSVAPATASIAAAPKPTPVAPKLTPRQQRLNMEMEYDAYDIVLEYLLSQGHTDTLEEALYVMMEMSAETIKNIVEVHAPPPIMSPPPANAPPPVSSKTTSKPANKVNVRGITDVRQTEVGNPMD